MPLCTAPCCPGRAALGTVLPTPSVSLAAVSASLLNIANPCLSTDLYATFAGLAGVPVADSGPVPVDGVNFWPALTQNTTSPRDSVVLQICSVTPEGKPTNFTGTVTPDKGLCLGLKQAEL
jgi:hypothetical protein